MSETVEVPGSDGRMHQVPAELADMFRDGDTGEFITDAQWDEQERRLAVNA